MVSIVHAARDIGRIRDISRVLVRHGFGEIAARLGLGKKPDSNPEVATHESTAVRLRKVLEELGPSFVKLGQIMSTRADLLPPDVISELCKLQDSVPPVPFAEIRERVEQSLGSSLSELFISVDEKPLAAASIAQVHRAVLNTAEGPKQVVIKVQRPGIAETIASDLDLLHSLAAVLQRTVVETRIYSPVGLVQQFDRAVTSELDFTAEAENAVRFSQNFALNRHVLFPRVYREVSTKHVITLEYLDGCKISEAVERGFSGPQLARVAMDLIVKQIFDDGFFHADPHPGNVLILGTPEAPVYALIDLGMVGRLSPRMRDLTVDLMIAASRRDYEGMAEALYAIATPMRKIDMRAFRGEVAILADRYLGKQLRDLELHSLVRDLVSTSTKYGLEVPPDFMLVGKTLMTIEGTGKQIAPDLDIIEEARPFFLEILRKRYSPERIGAELLRRVERLSGASSEVPEQMREVLEDLRLGRLTLRATDPTLLPAADYLGRRIFTALIASSLILAAAHLLSVGREWPAAVSALFAAISISWHTLRGLWRRWRGTPPA
jgi:ubiquinone biosynthesis protein